MSRKKAGKPKSSTNAMSTLTVTSSTKHPGGRPTKYTPELAERICAEIAEGKSIRDFAGVGDFPVQDTIYRWLDLHKEFSEQYSRAREIAADLLATEARDILEGKRPILNKLEGGMTLPDLDTAVRVSRDIARAKHCTWMAGRMAPRKWGEAVDAQENMAPPTAVIIVESTAAPRSASKADHREGHDYAGRRNRVVWQHSWATGLPVSAYL
jgi:hypothetical protein